MLSIKRQLSILVHLSNSDKDFAEEEKKYIIEIGIRNGLTLGQVEEVLEDPMGIPELKNIPPDERLDNLLSVIQLMKVDGKVRQEEIKFCEIMAMKLGYRPGVVAELSQHFYSDPKLTTAYSTLKNIADHYLLNP